MTFVKMKTKFYLLGGDVSGLVRDDSLYEKLKPLSDFHV